MDASTTTKPSYLQPAVVGGVVMGVLSALPLISSANLCCCLWVVTGGLVAAYLLQQNQATPITAGDGALVGLLAGLIGAVVVFIVSIPVGILAAPMERAILQRAIESTGPMPPNLRDALDRIGGQNMEGGGQLLLRTLGSLVFACIFVIVGSIFSTLGGLLGSAIFARRTAPPATLE